MKIDSHQHFWTLARGDYGWMSPDLGPIYRDFSPDDLAPLLEAAGIDRTVAVQAADTIAETEFLLQLAAENASVAGVVGWIDMEADSALTDLEQLAKDPNFKGIRPMVQDLADDRWLLRPELDQVFEALVAMDLSFDALVLPKHLPHLLQRLEKHPDLRCVIDHAAKPDLRNGQIADWATDIAQLARNTSCLCKFSGLLTEAPAGSNDGDLAPATEQIIAEFGAQRLMFGSDWPVLILAGDYAGWVAYATRLTGFEGAEAEAFWGGNASAFYRL